MIWRGYLVAIVFFSVADDAFAFCSKPDAPYCASQYDNFDDQDDFDSCKSQMESYKSEIEDFGSCLKREGDEAVDEYNDAVARFNQRAGS